MYSVHVHYLLCKCIDQHANSIHELINKSIPHVPVSMSLFYNIYNKLAVMMSWMLIECLTTFTRNYEKL